MSKARKCDRCGKLYESYSVKNKAFMEDGSRKEINSIMLIDLGDNGNYWPQETKDLCPECMEQFLKFWKMEDKQGWIPVSERLPEEGVIDDRPDYPASKRVAVTAKDLATGRVAVFTDYTINGEWSAFDRGEKGREVIAWIEPYKEGE